jgi:hypothetical protein
MKASELVTKTLFMVNEHCQDLTSWLESRGLGPDDAPGLQEKLQEEEGVEQSQDLLRINKVEFLKKSALPSRTKKQLIIAIADWKLQGAIGPTVETEPEDSAVHKSRASAAPLMKKKKKKKKEKGIKKKDKKKKITTKEGAATAIQKIARGTTT